MQQCPTYLKENRLVRILGFIYCLLATRMLNFARKDFTVLANCDVQPAAILCQNDSKLSEMDIFDDYLLEMSDSDTKKEINGVIKILVKKSLENQKIQEKVISWSKSESVEIIDPLVSTLREIKWWEISKIKEHMYEESSDLFVTRLLRGNRETVATEIRIKILSNSKRSEEMQARIIEDLVGRPIDEKTLKLIKEISNSESLLLSTISKEFLQEHKEI